MNAKHSNRPVYINKAFYTGETPLQKRFEIQKDLHLRDYSFADYLTETFQRQTCLHLAAAHGGIENIPREALTPKSIGAQDAFGNNVLHIAAITGRLSQLLIEDVPGHFFLVKNNQGKSVFEIAESQGNLASIPDSMRIWDPRFLLDKINEWCAQEGQGLIPTKLLDPDLWTLPIPTGVSHCTTALHIVAERRLLHHLPLSLTGQGSMLLENSIGETPLSVVIARGDLKFNLERIPSDFGWGAHVGLRGQTTYYHLLAKHRQIGLLDQIPEQSYLLKDRTGKTVLELIFKSGEIEVVPEHLRHLAEGYAESLLRKAIEGGSLADLPSWVKSPEYLLRKCDALLAKTYLETYLHRIAATGLLGQIPPNCIQPIHLKERDWDRNTVLHTLVTSGYAHTAPALWFSEIEVLCVKNADGASVYELAAVMPMLGSVPVSIFSKEVLLTNFGNGKNLADLIEEHDNTPLLPPELRNFSKVRAVTRLKECFSMDFVSAATLHSSEFSELIAPEQFQLMRLEFVREWFARHPNLSLDGEQAEAVAECGNHIQVTARAGSGKTRTLVARALFQITHCRVPASRILILAFNKKAVGEIRQRLSDYLSDEQMPHVLTFHALAYRIVRPAEDLIYDEGETKEGQVFSTTIQRIIDEGMRGGPLEAELRALMEGRWQADLKRIIRLGFNLPQEEFLDLRASLSETTMNGRRVNSEAHKHIGNALLRLGISYSYRRCIHRSAGSAYAPDFSHYHKETNQRFLIEVLGEDAAQANAARQAFWKSDRSANAHLLHLTEADCLDPDVTLERVTRELAVRAIDVSPMSAHELWLALRDDVIRDFTKAVKGFISRCQKELIEPEQLAGIIEARCSRSVEIQVQFWHLCEKIYARYRQVLIEQRQTDFDQLMLNAAGMIRDGGTGFKSARGSGDISQIRHLLIDEYQDFSHLFDELRKSIIARSPDVNFFCVGDDWQAINKFAGSDLRYFTDFTRTFEPSVRKLITRNYRSCRKVVEIGNRVMQSEGEPSIPNSNEQGNTWRVEVGAYGDLSEAEEVVIDELGDDALSILRIASDCTSRGESVTILSRTSSVATPEGMHKLERWQERLRSFLPEKDRKLLEASTTHGYKGKEADVVILLDPEAYPFVHPDAIFSTIFGDTFKSIRDDEKRLFYVGVTRPKRTLYLLSYPSQYSDERPYRIEFLVNAYPPSFDINRLQSNLLCGSRVVVRLTNRPGSYGNGGTFPIRDQLKDLKFKWNEDRKVWSIFLERGSISSPFECVQYLNAQPWIRNADGIVASFAWEDQQHRMSIVGGKVQPDGTAVPSPAKESSSTVQPEPGSTRTERASSAPLPSTSHPGLTNRPPKSSGVATGVFETRVAGMRYEGRMEKARHLAIGAFVRLEREPGNSHDRNAIQVLTAEGVRIGYVSRHVAAHLAPGLDAWGGTTPAKVTSNWTQPPPHFHVAIQIAFPLPPGVVIPQELDAKAHLEDNPFVDTRAPANTDRTPPPDPNDHLEPRESRSESPQGKPARDLDGPLPASPSTDGTPRLSGDLTQAQEDALGDLMDPSLGGLITGLYLSGCCPWPYIGYEGLDSEGRCTDSLLEVAWPDFKVGIALPTNEVSRFRSTGWTILPAATVTASAIQRLFETAAETAPSPRQESTKQSEEPATPIEESPSIGDFPATDRRFQHGPFIDEDADDDIPF